MTGASSLWCQGELSGPSTYYSQNGLFARLLHFPSDDQLVQDRIGFLKVENEIQLANLLSAPGTTRKMANVTHIPKVPIQNFDISMYSLQRDQLVISRRDGADEEE